MIEILERLAPGTQMRRALERIIQQGKGGLVVLGDGRDVRAACSGGFSLGSAAFNPARLAELAKMDGGIVLDDSWDNIVSANVHFIPDGAIPTDETGARHRTAERMAIQTGRPVVAVSEGRRVATLFYQSEKVELASATEVAAHVNQELQTLDRLRRRLDEAESRLTLLEVNGISTYRAAVVVLQGAELVRRVGSFLEARALTMGEEGRIVVVQLGDLVGGVEQVARVVLQDYTKPLRVGTVNRSLSKLESMTGTDLEDLLRVGKELGMPDLDELATPRGYRLLSNVSRLPDAVREDIVKHFRSFDRLLAATESELIAVEGVGESRARQLRVFLNRVLEAAAGWEPDID